MQDSFVKGPATNGLCNEQYVLQAAQIVCTLVGHKGRVNSVRWLSAGKNVRVIRLCQPRVSVVKLHGV